MGKKGKEKNKGKDESSHKKDETPPTKIDFSINYRDRKSPICVKVKHKNETFIIFSDEFHKAYEIKEQISLIKNIPSDSIRIYFSNKRIIDDEYMNYDQQIKHTTLLYTAFKLSNGEWENINELIKI